MGIFNREVTVVIASSMPTPGVLEESFIAGIGTSAFITVTPLVSSYLGSYFACQTAGCTIGSSIAGEFAGGSSASAAIIGARTVIYKMRYKNWLKENAGKYVVNRAGKLEMVPLAFIGLATGGISINPLTLIILTNSYYFFKGYINRKEEIGKHL